MGDSRPIGVFDSGLGGVSVLRNLRKRLPKEDFLFYGDTANAPYGTKPTELVLQCVDAVVQKLLSYQIKALVIACNTATGVAAQSLRARLAIPVIGMEPALKPAYEHRHGGKNLVLATPVTLKLSKFQALMEKYGEGAVPVPCPGLMELVQQGDFAAAKVYLAQKLCAFGTDHLDSVVLGCTHYVFLNHILRELLPANVEVLDGNEGTARQLETVLHKNQLLKPDGQGSITFLSSSEEPSAVEQMKKMMGLPL